MGDKPTPERKFLGMKRTIKKGKVTKSPITNERGKYSDPRLGSKVPSPLLNLNLRPDLQAFLPHKLPLSQINNEALKKLEFTEEPLKSKLGEEISDEELEHLVVVKTALVNSLKEHQEKVSELEKTISKWKVAFNSALEDLRLKPGVPSDTVELLEALSISAEFTKYLID